MAILGMDGFDHYPAEAGTTMETVDGYEIENNPERQDTVTTPTRFGTGRALRIYWDSPFKILVGSDVTDTMYVSFAYLRDTAQARTMIGFHDNGGVNYHGYVYSDASGYVKIYDANNSVIATSTSALSLNVWYWVEVKIFIHATTGTFQVKIDDSDWLNETGLDTEKTATTPLINKFSFFSGSSNYSYYDDLVWQDDDGDFLGPSRIETFMPNGEGSTIEWTPSTGTDNSALVDEIPTNDDTDYVSSATVTDLDLYDVDAISVTDTIHAIGIHTRAKKTDTGARSIESRTKSSTDEQGGVDKALSTTYGTFTDVFETTDSGTTAWTKTLFDAAEFGIKVTV